MSVGDGLIVHQVNCQKVMGAGLAKQIAQKFPQVKKEYLEKENWYLGDTQFVQVRDDLIVCNLAGQYDFGRKKIVYTNYHALREGFFTIRNFAIDNKVDVFLPYKIGCGLANGNWRTVLSLINYYFDLMNLKCFICKK